MIFTQLLFFIALDPSLTKFFNGWWLLMIHYTVSLFSAIAFPSSCWFLMEGSNYLGSDLHWLKGISAVRLTLVVEHVAQLVIIGCLCFIGAIVSVSLRSIDRRERSTAKRSFRLFSSQLAGVLQISATLVYGSDICGATGSFVQTCYVRIFWITISLSILLLWISGPSLMALSLVQQTLPEWKAHSTRLRCY